VEIPGVFFRDNLVWCFDLRGNIFTFQIFDGCFDGQFPHHPGLLSHSGFDRPVLGNRFDSGRNSINSNHPNIFSSRTLNGCSRCFCCIIVDCKDGFQIGIAGYEILGNRGERLWCILQRILVGPTSTLPWIAFVNPSTRCWNVLIGGPSTIPTLDAGGRFLAT
jgi:hypothetical protein